MKIEIPKIGKMELCTLILDLNGTLTVHGRLVRGIAGRIKKLKKQGFKIVLFSGDTRGNGMDLAQKLDIEFVKTFEGKDKALAAQALNPRTCVAIGNGRIDIPLFRAVKLSIATIQGEGVYGEVFREVDIITTSIGDALDLLLNEKSLIATLRS